MTSAADMQGLLAAVIAEPDSDALRLIYADAAEDAGDPARAEFIRLNIAAAAELSCPVLRDTGKAGMRCGSCDWCRGYKASREGAADRAKALWVAHGGRWALPLAEAFGFAASQIDMPPTHAGERGRVIRWSTRRGFIDSVTCPLVDWLAHGREAAKIEPLEAVRLDRSRPYLLRQSCDYRAWDVGAICDDLCVAAMILARPGGEAIADSLGLSDAIRYALGERAFSEEGRALDAMSGVLLGWARRDGR